jgi:PAS domain-containing protein
MARLLATGEQRLIGKRIEIPAMRADGMEFPVELTIVRIGTDRPWRFTAFLRDITDRVSAREKLEAQEEQYRVLFETNPSAMWVPWTRFASWR